MIGSSLRHLPVVGLATIGLALFVTSFIHPAAAQHDASYYQQRDELISTEKELLRADDDLGGAIFEIKRTIDALFEKLSAMQDQQDQVRHSLITVKMKLMD